MDLMRQRHAETIFSEDGSSIDEQIAGMLSGRRMATAESCNGRVVGGAAHRSARRIRVSDGRGRVVRERGEDECAWRSGEFDRGTRRRFTRGRGSDGRRALRRFDADTAVAITGVAGPEGGTKDKPVGTVWFSVMLADGATLTRRVQLPGQRSDIRERSTTVAMHLLRQVLLDHDEMPPANGVRRERGALISESTDVVVVGFSAAGCAPQSQRANVARTWWRSTGRTGAVATALSGRIVYAGAGTQAGKCRCQ